jgi:uncharacterized protein (TIGR02145 family)
VETRTCPGDASPAETRDLYPKCGSEEYNPATKFCQSPNVVKDLCGTATYTADKFCNGSDVLDKCGGTVIFNPGTEQCCGSSKYALSTHFCDARDNKSYKYKLIGTQTWMAENLNYDTTDASKCYGDDDANCVKYGRLYNWATAMAGSASSAENPSGVKGVCPEDWHIPSNAEWDALYRHADGTNGTDSPYSSPTAGTKLKASTGWNSYDGVPVGSDDFGFSALPGGNGYSDGSFDGVGNRGRWWSATENFSSYAYGRYMDYYGEDAGWLNGNKNYLFSVRCLQD